MRADNRGRRKKSSFASLGPEIYSSALITVLEQKIAAAESVRFRFADHLNAFAERVSGEVPFVRLTFPEFTDHTADIHFPNLFSLATKLLGQSLLEQLFAEELFVLAAALYAHDWGMAVSDAERRLIVADEASDYDPAWILADERERFRKFTETHAAGGRDHAKPMIGETEWREYVRLTHADRSAIRAQRYFENIDGGVAQAVAALCKGHWLDIEKIDAEKEFPAELNVIGARINLRALALFIRLIDLFDIAEDRTPFAIWRFVGPRDPKSQQEWKKHRALRPVHTETYLGSRCVVVDGTASDPSVYADLVDLRNYCEKQLRETCDLLARHHDERLPFDLAPIIHWNVKPQGFDETEIRFEFDRGRMFEILGGEIYRDDPCVFLRELLQNAIDAIATRRDLQKNRPREGVVEGLIEFRVAHDADGSCIVSCKDNGIGMDDYIVRRYLAVAGKSFYRSDDFDRLGVTVDPISKFGIGLLSCFMVADRIEIATRRDPTLSPTAKPTRFEIIEPERQWRVYRNSSGDIGTTVTVHVKGNALFDDNRELMSKLPVTEYLASIAGFVEFPILIEESERSDPTQLRRSIVLHPDLDPSVAIEFGQNVEVYQLHKSYPIEDALVAEDLETASKYFTSETLSVSGDLEISGCEGFVTALCLRDDALLAKNSDDKSAEKRGIALLESNGHELVRCIGLQGGMRRYSDEPSTSSTRSARRAVNWSVYLDGILLASMPAPRRWSSRTREAPLPLPVLRLNYRSTQVSAAVSRLTLEADGIEWDSQLFAALIAKLSKQATKAPRNRDLVRATSRLAMKAYSYGLTEKDFAQVVKNWPVLAAWVTPSGEPEFAEMKVADTQEIRIAPDAYHSELQWYVSALAYDAENRSRLETDWRGHRSLVRTSYEAQLAGYLAANAEALLDDCEVRALEFVIGPDKQGPPLPQEIFARKAEGLRSFEEVVTIGLETPMNLSLAEREMVGDSFRRIASWNAFRAVAFRAPFSDRFACGSSYWNSLHPRTSTVARAAICLVVASNRRPDDKQMRRLRYLFNEAMNPLQYLGGGSVRGVVDAWNLFWDEFETSSLAPDLVRPSFPTAEDFVPGTWEPRGASFSLFDWNEEKTYDFVNVPFGQPLAKWPTARTKRTRRRPSGRH